MQSEIHLYQEVQRKKIPLHSLKHSLKISPRAQAVFDIKSVMKEMTKEGKTIFFSTHILDVAEKLCDRVAIIKNGNIIKIGKMKDIKGDSSLEEVFLELEEK